MAPKVSVICPMHNRSSAILPTIESVRRQDERDWELIAVLDGCTDDTQAWVGEVAALDSRIRVIRTPGFGHPSEPRNIGLRAARGDVIAYLDHDDRWAPDHLSVVCGLIGDAEVVATGCERRDELATVLGYSDRITQCWHPELQLLSPLFEPSRVAHRAGVVQGVGGWRAGAGLEDWELWVRLADAGHRFHTSIRRTAMLTQHRSSRRYATVRPHRIELAAFADARSAHRARTELGGVDCLRAITAAAVQDARQWYRRLRLSGELIHPSDGWNDRQDPAGFDAELAAAVRRSAATWADDLVVVSRAGRVAIGLALWSATPELSHRVEELSRRVLARQFEVIAAVARDHGGVSAMPQHDLPSPILR